MSDLLFSVSGLRGVVGSSLTPDLLARYAAAFGRLVGPGPIAIGRDTRPSGDMVQATVTGALTAVGCDVVDLGIAATPAIQYAVENSDAVGGLCVTASHNPFPWNALKFVGGDGLFLPAARIAELAALVQREAEGDHAWVPAERIGRARASHDAIARYIDAVLALDLVDVEAVRAWKPRVVLDCVNGAGATSSPQLLERLGCEVELLYCEPNGIFPRGAEPLPENLTALSERVVATGAACGLAHDPDADRLAIVGPDGVPLGEEMTLVLACDAVLSRTPGPVATNLSTTRGVDDVAQRYGVAVTRTPVGEANVVTGMKACGAIIGGEGNGGVIYPALHYGRDAAVGIGLVLSHVARSSGSFAALVQSLPRYTMAKRKIARPAGAAPFAADAVAAAFAQETPTARIDRADGVRVDTERGWVHVRPSGTEPVVRVIAEGTSAADVDALCQLADRALAAAS